jgi:hypothetical protein
MNPPELVFTKLILQVLYRIYEIAIHSRIFMLYLPTKIDLRNYYLLIIIIILFLFWRKSGCF